MKVKRRDVLKTGALLGSAVALGGCERLISAISTPDIPESFSVASGAEIDPAFHLLSRAAYGPRAGDLDRVQEIGAEAWIDRQLAPESIDDFDCNLRARRFETIHHEPGNCFEYKKQVLRREITRHTLLRAIYSERQLLEVMVNFWTDHLNIDLDKGDCIYLKASDDREVVRKHALGRFRDLIRASATSPAMLIYLDGDANKKAKSEDVPNENYARELLELHTLGVHGGYTQNDVQEVARCLTGWRMRRKWRRGAVEFRAGQHDAGEKTVLGRKIPAREGQAGAQDLEDVVDICCAHPSTAKYIASKLVRKFVADVAPAGLVDRVAREFTRTGGEIKPLVRMILTSDEFNSNRGTRMKRPFRFVATAMRALGVDTHARPRVTEYLGRMGQLPFTYPTPDGYPEERGIWLGTLLWRWNFAFATASGQLGRVPAEDLARGLGAERPADVASSQLWPYLIGRTPTNAEAEALDGYLAKLPDKSKGGARGRVGLILASPAYQRY